MKMTKECRNNSIRFATIAGILIVAATGCNGGNDEAALQLASTEPGVVTPKPSPTATASPKPSPKPSAAPSPTPTGSDLYTGPAELEKYVVKFVDDAKAQGVDVLPYMKGPKLVLKIANLDSYSSKTIGVCVSSSTKRNVTVDPDFWNSASEARRELLMHHELGHCVLDRRHRTTKLSNGNFASLMYPSIMPGSTYLNNYNYYQSELFASTYRGWDADRVGSEDVDVVDICDEDEIPAE